MISDVNAYASDELVSLAGFPEDLYWIWNRKFKKYPAPLEKAKGTYFSPKKTGLPSVSMDYCANTVQCTTDGFPNFETFCGEMMDLDIAGEYLMSEWEKDHKVTACFRRLTKEELASWKATKPPTPAPPLTGPHGGPRSYVSQVAFRCGKYIAYANAKVPNAFKFIKKSGDTWKAMDTLPSEDDVSMTQNLGGGKIVVTCPGPTVSAPSSAIFVKFGTVKGVKYVTLDVSVDADAIYKQKSGGLCQDYPCKGGTKSYRARGGKMVKPPGSAYLGTTGSVKGALSWYEDSLLKIVGQATGVEDVCVQSDSSDFSASLDSFLSTATGAGTLPDLDLEESMVWISDEGAAIGTEGEAQSPKAAMLSVASSPSS